MSNFSANSVSNFNSLNAQKAIEYFLHNTWYINDDQVAALILAELGDNYNVGNISVNTYHKIDMSNDSLGLSLSPVVRDGLNRVLSESQMTYEELDDILGKINEEERYNDDSEFDNTEGFTEWRNRICMFKENAYKEADMPREDLEHKIAKLLSIAKNVDQGEIWWQTWNHIERDWDIIYSRMTPNERKKEIEETENIYKYNIEGYDKLDEEFIKRKLEFLKQMK